MGNVVGKACLCSAGGAGDISLRHNNSPLGNSICYVRPPDQFPNDDVSFRSISGASVSANSSTSPSTTTATAAAAPVWDSPASFETNSSSFTTTPSSIVVPLHHASRAGCSSSTSSTCFCCCCCCSHEYGCIGEKEKPRKQNSKEILMKVVSAKGCKNKKRIENIGDDVTLNGLNMHNGDDNYSLDELKRRKYLNYGDDGGDVLLLMGSENLQWAKGRAGEDRVHIVISEEHGWVFVGIYDGFNGPDATDYLVENLFYAVHHELKEVLLCGYHNHKQEESLGNGRVDGGQCCSSISNEEKCPMIGNGKLSSDDVLVALSRALRKTEDEFLEIVDGMIGNDPVLAMMGSCVLVMLMKGEHVYLMNVGDSRAVLATNNASSIQLTIEHSTQVKEEVQRIRKEHPHDPYAITKGRVKGCLNVTRAFGAGFLKQPKQNNAVLETFKVNYIGDSPYITCSPSLHHHRLSPSDRFLILSSDGLHQYFTNEEAVAKVESFITSFPDRDPAQLLIEEALFRAAEKAGMQLHELLDIPQGERRLYHDDISIVIISFDGKIWRSSM